METQRHIRIPVGSWWRRVFVVSRQPTATTWTKYDFSLEQLFGFTVLYTDSFVFSKVVTETHHSSGPQPLIRIIWWMIRDSVISLVLTAIYAIKTNKDLWYCGIAHALMVHNYTFRFENVVTNVLHYSTVYLHEVDLHYIVLWSLCALQVLSHTPLCKFKIFFISF